jgi:hypothetical protein
MLLRVGKFFLEITVGSLACVAAHAACENSAYRQFDFWIGEWEVHTPEGKLAGTNRITREYEGCVLHERYTTARGYSGESLNTYEPGRQVWHQTWVDNEGTLLLLEGKLVDGRMRLEGENVDGAGKVIRHRITWTPNPDGTVRQFWETTDANGQWTTAFDGRYSKK